MNVAEHLDQTYAEVDGHKLKLDLYLPAGSEGRPLVMYIHGGGWRKGSRKRCPVKNWALPADYPVASISYRLSDQALFPAAIHDAKAAVRWLRAHAKEYGYDGDRIVAAGGSAGAHLALFLGVTNGMEEWEGEVGEHPDTSSDVQAVIDYWGPSDFPLRAKTNPRRALTTTGGSYIWLGGKDGRIDPEVERRASPVTWVSEGDPPLLIFQGDADPVVLPVQSERMAEGYREAGLDVTLHLIPGGKHGAWQASRPPWSDRTVEWLRERLGSKP